MTLVRVCTVARANITLLLGDTALPLKERALLLAYGESNSLTWACYAPAKIQSVALHAPEDVTATSFKVNDVEKLDAPATALELARHPALVGLRLEPSAILKLTLERANPDAAE